MRSSKAAVRLPEPLRENAVLGHPVQHAVRSHDSGIDRSRKHQNAHKYDECLESEPQMVRADKIHRQAADQVAEVLGADRVGNDHEREEGDAGGKDQAINKNDEAGLLQVAELGMLNFAVDLRQSFLTAHGQDGVPQTNKNANEPDRVRQARMAQPAERTL